MNERRFFGVVRNDYIESRGSSGCADDRPSSRKDTRPIRKVAAEPAVQAYFGIDPASTKPLRKAAKSALHRELVQRRIAELKARIPVGGIREATIRALIHIGLAREGVDERGFEAIRRIRRAHEDLPAIPLADFKTLVRDQFFMLLIDPDGAVAALAALLPDDADIRRKALGLIHQVLAARGGLTGEAEARMQQIACIFAHDSEAPAAPNLAVVPPIEKALREAS